MKMPLVSVVMPTFNAAIYIVEAIHSIALQQYPNLELIIVDGGSTDGTCEIIEKYMGDGDVVLLKTPPKSGLSRDLNAGLAAAKGEFIARMDADDVSFKERFTEQVHFLVQNREIDLVGSGVSYIGLHGGEARSPATHLEIRDTYLVNNPFFHPSVMFRRELYDRGIYRYNSDFDCDEDYELWGRLIGAAKLSNLNWALMHYRIHGGNSQRTPKRYRFKRRALKAFMEEQKIHQEELLDALVEFQCSSFISPVMFEILRVYGKRAEDEGLPRLGWVHHRLIHSRSYGKFIEWYWRIKGWRM